jgi:hypothetical protein
MHDKDFIDEAGWNKNLVPQGEWSQVLHIFVRSPEGNPVAFDLWMEQSKVNKRDVYTYIYIYTNPKDVTKKQWQHRVCIFGCSKPLG